MDCSDDEDVIILMYLVKRIKKKRRYWVHPILQRRLELGKYHRLVQELELDRERFHQYFRMSSEKLEYILGLVGRPAISKPCTNFRKSVSAKEIKVVTLS